MFSSENTAAILSANSFLFSDCVEITPSIHLLHNIQKSRPAYDT